MSTLPFDRLIVSFSEVNYREFLESAPDALVLTNRTGTILFVNAQAERLFGYTQAELLGAPVEMLLPERFRTGHVEHRAGYCTSPRFRPMGSCAGLYMIRKDGTELPVDISLSYQQTEIGLVVLAALRDITERKRLEANLEAMVEDRTRELTIAGERLEAASRYKSEFLNHMSHELRTPLNSILGFAEVLRDPAFGPLTEQQARFAHNILTAGEHLLLLVNDLLDLSRVEAGKIDFRPGPFDLRDALRTAMTGIRPQADQKRLTLRLDLDEAPSTLTADPVRFKQILSNLLSNAVKFTPDDGRITIAARRDPSHRDFVDIVVADSGIGIKPDDLSRLFQGFVRLDAAVMRHISGTGLGLAPTKRLVDLHGGAIAVASEGEGRGSTFTVRLPLTTST